MLNIRSILNKKEIYRNPIKQLYSRNVSKLFFISNYSQYMEKSMGIMLLNSFILCFTCLYLLAIKLSQEISVSNAYFEIKFQSFAIIFDNCLWTVIGCTRKKTIEVIKDEAIKSSAMSV